jgi:uncharacterized membrane protein
MRECVREPFENFREDARPCLEDAKAQRREILQQLKDGLIAQEEARELIKALDDSTSEAIENCPACVAAGEAMCDCKLTLIANIESILTDTPLTAWNDWLSNLEGP